MNNPGMKYNTNLPAMFTALIVMSQSQTFQVILTTESALITDSPPVPLQNVLEFK